MRQPLKLVLWLAVAVLVAPFIAFAAYDLLAFQPRMSEIRRVLAQASPAETEPPESLRKVLKASHTENLSARVGQLVLVELDAAPRHGGMLGWHLTSAAWWALVAAHLSEREQVTLFLALSPMGNNIKGFANASPGLVGASLNTVSIEQAATLVAVSWSPSQYLANPERSARRAEVLAQRSKNAL